MHRTRYVYLVIAKIGYDRHTVAVYSSRAKAEKAKADLEVWDKQRSARPGYASYATEFEIECMGVL